MTVEDIHRRIRELSDERGWTLYRLADEIQMSHSTLYNMMKRQTMPKIDTLERMCERFGISLSAFFSFQNESNNTWLEDSELELVNISRSLSARGKDRLLHLAKGMQVTEAECAPCQKP